MSSEVKPGQTVYVTKYAVSAGGTPTVEVVREVSGDFVYIEGRAPFYSLRLGRDVFVTEAEANESILRAFDRKIAQVKKQLQKLEQGRKTVAERCK